MGDWVIPFKGRRPSAQKDCNFLWRQGNVYVMDNHLLALWCWYRHVRPDGGPYNLLHVDAHYDCDPSLAERLPRACEGVDLASVEQYLALGHFRWDNYVPVFMRDPALRLDKTVSVTHKLGIPGEFTREIEPYDLLKHLDDLLLFDKSWVVNVDFDYFFARSYKSAPMFSDDYIKEVFKLMKLNHEMGHIEVLTACLSPECCGGWEQAERILRIFAEQFALEIGL